MHNLLGTRKILQNLQPQMMLKYLYAPVSVKYIYNTFSQIFWYTKPPAS
jgi:hypothetical protein